MIVRILQIVNWSNIPIAMSAVGWTCTTFFVLKTSPDIVLVTLSFLFTWFFYARDRTNITKEDIVNNPKRVAWVKSHLYFQKLVWVAAFLILICLLLRPAIILPSVIGIIPCILYGTPVKLGKHEFTLKKIPGMKVILVALLWAVLTVLFPLLSNTSIVSSVNIFWELWLMVLFLIMTQIHICDLRDIEGDRKENILSFAVLLGDTKARIFGLFLVGISIYWGWGLFNSLALLLLGGLLAAQILWYNKQNEIYWRLPISSLGLIAYFILISFSES